MDSGDGTSVFKINSTVPSEFNLPVSFLASLAKKRIGIQELIKEGGQSVFITPNWKEVPLYLDLSRDVSKKSAFRLFGRSPSSNVELVCLFKLQVEPRQTDPPLSVKWPFSALDLGKTLTEVFFRIQNRGIPFGKSELIFFREGSYFWCGEELGGLGSRSPADIIRLLKAVSTKKYPANTPFSVPPRIFWCIPLVVNPFTTQTNNLFAVEMCFI